MVVFFVSAWAWSQEDAKVLQGRVTSADGDVAATHVLNITTQKATIADANGFFSVRVSLKDTLVFSAVQYQKKTVVVTQTIWNSSFLTVPLEPLVNELDEVTVTPYNLTGDITRDVHRIAIDPVVTSSTLGLPNAYVKKLTQSERLLRSASHIPFEGAKLAFDPIINSITGRTKMLKERVERDRLYGRTHRVQQFYTDSVYQKDLGLPFDKLDDFFYFCEVDPAFQKVVDSHDRMRIWEFLRKKSIAYRENNNLD